MKTAVYSMGQKLYCYKGTEWSCANSQWRETLSNVLSATHVFVGLLICKFTWIYTVVRDPLNVLNVTKALEVLAIWIVTYEFTVARNPWNVLNVTNALHVWEIWILTCEFTVSETNPSYKCTQCGRCFSQSGSLQRHMMMHSGEKPFKCTTCKCGKCFARKRRLSSHSRLFHNDLPG